MFLIYKNGNLKTGKVVFVSNFTSHISKKRNVRSHIIMM